MSLDWDASKVENFETIKETDWEDTKGIIFGCMVTGIGTITEKNYKEWYARHAAWSKLNGFPPIPSRKVKAMIGLKTNVFPQETRSAWMKRVITRQLEDLVRMVGE